MEKRVSVGEKNYNLNDFSRALITNCELPEAHAEKVREYLENISRESNGKPISSTTKGTWIVQRALTDWQLKFCRLTLFALAAVFSQVTQAMLETRDMSGNQIVDYVLVWTDFLNQLFWQHSTFTNYYIIFCSLFMDFYSIVLPCLVVFGKDKHPNRVVLAVTFFFILRQFFQTLIVLPTPKGYLWRYPGFPSLVVPYNPANDFYFSGHIEFLTVAARELIKRKHWILFVGSLFAIFFNSMMIIITRIHYTIDVIDAIFVAWFAVDLAEMFSPKLEQFFKTIVQIVYKRILNDKRFISITTTKWKWSTIKKSTVMQSNGGWVDPRDYAE